MVMGLRGMDFTRVCVCVCVCMCVCAHAHTHTHTRRLSRVSLTDGTDFISSCVQFFLVMLL